MLLRKDMRPLMRRLLVLELLALDAPVDVAPPRGLTTAELADAFKVPPWTRL